MHQQDPQEQAIHNANLVFTASILEKIRQDNDDEIVRLLDSHCVEQAISNDHDQNRCVLSIRREKAQVICQFEIEEVTNGIANAL